MVKLVPEKRVTTAVTNKRTFWAGGNIFHLMESLTVDTDEVVLLFTRGSNK